MSEFREQRYRHATYGTIKGWRERHGRYRLEGSRCKACGAVGFPRRVSCRSCHGRDLAPYQCSHQGTVIVAWPQPSLTRLMGYADLPQRFVAVIELDDGVRVEAELVELGGSKPKPGLRVGVVFRKLRRESNGDEMYGYKFRPLDLWSPEADGGEDGSGDEPEPEQDEDAPPAGQDGATDGKKKKG